MQKPVLLLLVLLFSQVLADLITDLGSPSACTENQNADGVSGEAVLYGVSSFISGVLAIIPGAEIFGGALAVVNTVWVRKNIIIPYTNTT